ncbi:MAG: ankyrin repeat domain-containing protein [Bacteroidales bacterium]|nr:ankyrin repeat domain-containing protein [Bacteroidales bacterium]
MYKSLKQIIIILLFVLSPCIVFSQDNNILILPDTSYKITDPNFELLLAASEGDTSKIKALIEFGADVNYTNYDDVTPLMFAAQNGHLRSVEILIDKGANVNALPYNNVSALLGACISGHVLVVDTLILNSADINTENLDGVTPLMYAVAYDDFVMADMLIFYNADIGKKDAEGNTALQYAVYYDNPEITEILLSNGANINTIDNNGFTPLMVASQNGYYEHLDYLIQNGAEINTTNINNLNALSLAIINKHYEIIDFLLSNGADANLLISDNLNQMTLAQEFGNKDIRNLLQLYGSQNNPKPRFDKLLIGADINGNSDDFMLGGNLSLMESKYKVQLQIGYKTRPAVRSVLYQLDENTYYQFWEKRSCIHIGIDKYFVLLRSSLKSSGGIYTGLNGSYTYGSFRGSNKKPDDKFILIPKAGIFLKINQVRLGLNYEYMNLKNTKVSPHRIDFSIAFIINLTKDKISLKEEPKL